VKFFHLSGTASSGKIALTGQTDSHAPQSMHSSGWMKYMLSASVVYMQSTGQTSRQLASFTPMHGSVITYAIASPFLHSSGRAGVSKCIIANAYERNRRVPLAQ